MPQRKVEESDVFVHQRVAWILQQQAESTIHVSFIYCWAGCIQHTKDVWYDIAELALHGDVEPAQIFEDYCLGRHFKYHGR